MGEVSYLPSILRAMAKNYADGHCWDHLDSEAVEKSADCIEALEAERNVLDLLCQERFDELAMLKAENAKLSAELSTVKKVAYGNMELLEENAKLRAELERRESDEWKLVPVEPTPEMLDAAIQDGICVDGKPVWKKDVVFQAKWKYQQMLAAYQRAQRPHSAEQERPVPQVCMGCVEQASRIRELEHKMDYYTTTQPSAGVVMPERQSPNDEWHYVMRERSHGWNACLDEFTRLNGKEAL